jgi:hypothetical protein
MRGRIRAYADASTVACECNRGACPVTTSGWTPIRWCVLILAVHHHMQLVLIFRFPRRRGCADRARHKHQHGSVPFPTSTRRRFLRRLSFQGELAHGSLFALPSVRVARGGLRSYCLGSYCLEVGTCTCFSECLGHSVSCSVGRLDSGTASADAVRRHAVNTS